MKITTAIGLLAGLVLSGCAGGGSGPGGGLPQWALDGQREASKPGVYYGVGLSRLEDPVLARNQADRSATAKIVSQLAERQRNRSRTYAESTGKRTHRMVKEGQRTRADSLVQGVRIIKRHVGGDGTWYALAKLDLNRADASHRSLLEEAGDPEAGQSRQELDRAADTFFTE